MCCRKNRSAISLKPRNRYLNLDVLLRTLIRSFIRGHLGPLGLGCSLYWPYWAWKIDHSGYFDKEFYLAQGLYGDLGLLPKLFPIFHYIWKGSKEGLNPGPEFDGRWYCSAYPDIAASGMCPLAHYVISGRYEGRLPRQGAAPPFIESLPSITQTRWLAHKLWQGFPHLAEPTLRRKAKEEKDTQASLALASWSYAQNRVEEALTWLETPAFAAAKGPRLELGRLRGLVKCYSLLGRRQSLTRLLSEPGVVEILGPDAGLAQANSDASATGRLAAVNRRLSARGLLTVEANGELSLSGLKAVENSEIRGSFEQHFGSQPLISVIMPAYNAGADLAVAIDSLLQQTWQSLEILVVDDASTDDTGDWARECAKRDDRVRYFRNERNLGAYPTRNRGLSVAQGEFVTVHDSDDWSHPQKLESQVRPLLDDDALSASVSHLVRVSPDMRFVGSWIMGNEFVEPNASSWLVRRHRLQELGGWDAVNVGGDSEFSQRLEHYLGRDSLYFLWPDTPLSFARVEAGTLTRVSATHQRTLFYGLRRLYSEAAKWWLRRGLGAPVITGERPFPVPLGNVRFEQKTSYECVIAGNFALRGQALSELLDKLYATIAEYDLNAVCLLHWPDYNAWHTNTIADEVFAFCQDRGLHFAHVGLTLHAQEVRLLDSGLWEKPPTETVQIEGLKKVSKVDGSLCEDQTALCEYFLRGGVPRAI